MCVLEETHSLAVWTVYFSLAQVYYLSVLVEFRVVVGGVQAQYDRGGRLYHQQLLQFEFHVSQLLSDE